MGHRPALGIGFASPGSLLTGLFLIPIDLIISESHQERILTGLGGSGSEQVHDPFGVLCLGYVSAR